MRRISQVVPNVMGVVIHYVPSRAASRPCCYRGRGNHSGGREGAVAPCTRLAPLEAPDGSLHVDQLALREIEPFTMPASVRETHMQLALRLLPFRGVVDY